MASPCEMPAGVGIYFISLPAQRVSNFRNPHSMVRGVRALLIEGGIMMPRQNQCCSCCCCRDHASDALFPDWLQVPAAGNAEAYLSKLKAAGFDGFITTEAVNDAAQ